MFRLNLNPGRPTVVHREHPFEECNLDDALDREWCDVEAAQEMVAEGRALFCEHCLPEGIIE